MLMLPRRNRRRFALAAIAAGSLLAVVVTAPPAAAVGGGFDPQAAPVTIPGTSSVVNDWKLAGLGFAQGVQVAPQWILASGHAPLGVGGRFTNEYGSATVDRVTVCATQFSGCDISVSHLSTPIAAPGFPALSQDGVPAEAGRTAAGDTLAVGNGGSTLGRPDAGWTRPTPEGFTLDTLQAGVSSINGDSGGPAFFYRRGATTGTLQGLMTSAATGIIDGLTQFTSARIKPFLDANLPAGTVNWTTYDQLGPRLYVPEPVDTPTATATPTTVTLSWPSVTATPAVTGYRAVLIRTDNVKSAQVISTSATTNSVTFTGLPTGVPFGAFVLPSNANGESRVSFRSTNGGVPPTVSYVTTVAASGPPGGVRQATVVSRREVFTINVTHGDGYVDGVSHTDLVVSQCPYGQCGSTNPPPKQIISTTFAGPSTFVAIPTDTPPGAMFEITMRDTNTAGVSPGSPPMSPTPRWRRRCRRRRSRWRRRPTACSTCRGPPPPTPTR